ncbi:hypothetical protein Glove_83g16 [Diversispora epigaea]|uniref:Uncharacterized protein n=1 Tax=Diversispora epigaea TaxID=1348612 RepID=A0A397JID8_9GLOM|nr:hypothetical protein Glove_83g16 [Diversispora epigaea]
MNDKFDLMEERYADWPRSISKVVANNALAEFRESVGYDSLRELPCAVCSGLCSNEHWTVVSVREINLLLLEASKYYENPFFEVDFVYGHPYICESGCKILLDKDGFIERGTDGKNDDSFDLQICNGCK